jgi:hypothetical protein
MRLPQPGGPGPRIYIPQEQGGPDISLGTGFPFRRLLRLTVLLSKSKLYYDQQSVGQSVLVLGNHLGPATNFSHSLFDYFSFLTVSGLLV